MKLKVGKHKQQKANVSRNKWLPFTSGLQSTGQHLSALEPDGVRGDRGTRKTGVYCVGSDFRGFAFAAGITAGTAAGVNKPC